MFSGTYVLRQACALQLSQERASVMKLEDSDPCTSLESRALRRSPRSHFSAQTAATKLQAPLCLDRSGSRRADPRSPAD